MNLFNSNNLKALFKISLGSFILMLNVGTINVSANTNTSTITCEENGTGFATIESYINRYKHIAIEEMQNAGIPASIKLAQAILESRYGNSELAINANNHFGIKCGSTWIGLTTYADDDKANECFRKYRSSYESFIDHTQFLEQPRYASLYNIPITDYKSWARGLKNAGYATNPNYANLLIDIIERHELYKIDQQQTEREVVLVTNNSPVESSRQFQTVEFTEASTAINRSNTATKTSSRRLDATEPMYYNGIKTIILESPATAQQVEMLYGIGSDKICLYNNVAPNEVIPANTKIYLQPMRNKAPKNMIAHTVASGETMEEISQYYGIKLSKLYKRNKMKTGQQPAPGQVVFLRGKADYTPGTLNTYEDPNFDVQPTKSTVVITNNNMNNYNETEVDYNQPSVTDRSYYDIKKPEYTEPKTTQTTNTASIQYFNDNSDSDNYANYKPVKETKEVVNNNVVTETTKVYVETQPEVTTYHTSNNNGKAYGNIGNESSNTSNSTISVNKSANTTTKYYQGSNTASSIDYSDSYVVSSGINSSAYTNTINTPVTTSTTYTYNTSIPKSEIVTHTVVKGDTLYNISQRNNTTVEDIKELNGLRTNTIKLGQRLKVKTNTKFTY